MGHLFYFILMLNVIGDFYILASRNTRRKIEDKMLWCSVCGVHVADITDSVDILSKGAIKVENKIMLGRNVSVQTLANRNKYVFDVIITRQASCADVGQNTAKDTWFPGYTWRVCTCPHCSMQLGWTFEKVLTNDVGDMIDKAPFHALKLTSVLTVSNSSHLMELTTPYPKWIDLTASTQPVVVQKTSEAIEDSAKPTTVSDDNTSENKPSAAFNDTVATGSKADFTEGKIVVLQKRSRNSTRSQSNTVSRNSPNGATPKDML